MKCELCGETDRTVLVGMKPGKDGVPWWLCVKDWSEGRTPFKLGRFKAETTEEPQKRRSA
jgi:hypothetical protein